MVYKAISLLVVMIMTSPPIVTSNISTRQWTVVLV